MGSLKILLIEDNPGDARLVEEALCNGANAGRHDLEWAPSLEDGLRRLDAGGIDVLLLDLGLPESTGIETFRRACAEASDVPIIVLTSLDDEWVADSAVAMGAQDYIVKAEIEGNVLGRAIRYALERKRAELDLRRVNAELEGYARTVSHDLRSPLSAITLACEVLGESYDLELEEFRNEASETITIIRRNVGKCHSLIEELLALARAGQRSEDVSDVDLSEIVGLVLEEKQVEIAGRGMSIRVDEDLGKIRATDAHMYQLFSNLINNAIQHNASAQPRLEVRFLGTGGGSARRYLVRDNGRGIPAELMNVLTMPFVKGGESGVGIGLSIVQKIVKLYGGELKAYNDPGPTFEFTLGDIPGQESSD